MDSIMQSLEAITAAYTTGDQATINTALDNHQAASAHYLHSQEAAATAVRNTIVWS